ncbi:DUF6950 family protein [Enterovirga aerilata]|uniref:DUF6950 domain-containing protein n=1 Tax=Enterovirga aerilata TaxID=2730920 RepID=A0A849IF47_9HYPH|nr:hypothetical protein [Enterovirga sp. DB1703]NNM75069.1 hypothetical protein [Enterovirga sp. DB1703]
MAGLLVRDRAAELRAFITRGFGLPLTRGGSDCCLWPCDWIVAWRGLDPAAQLRGRYRTALGAERHLRRAGGLLPLARRLMAETGLPEAVEPVPGDVGVVMDRAGQIIMAIRDGQEWAAKADEGVLIEDLPMLAAWSI